MPPHPVTPSLHLSGSDVQPIEQHGEPPSISEFDGSPEAGRVDRLAADRRLLDQLMLEGYQGPAWDAFAEALAGYAFQVVKAWLATGKIYLQCHARGFGVPRHRPRRLDKDDRDELAAETVACALALYRKKVLIPGRWDATRGASLKTYFVGACLHAFPNVIKRWCKENEPLPTGLLPEDGRLDRSPTALELLLVEERVESIRDEPTRRIVQRTLEGEKQDDIGHELGLTARAVESKLRRLRETDAFRRPSKTSHRGAHRGVVTRQPRGEATTLTHTGRDHRLDRDTKRLASVIED